MTNTFEQQETPASNEAESQNTNSGDNHGGTDELSIIKKRLDDSQEFIETLKRETKELRDRNKQMEEDLTRARSLDEVLDAVRESERGSTSEPTAPRFDENELLSKLEERVFQNLSQRQREELENENWNKTNELLKGKFGDKYIDQVNQRAKELGMPVSEMDRIAKTSPQALYDLVAGPSSTTSRIPQPTQSSVNTSVANAKTNTSEYFSKISGLRHLNTPEGLEARKVWKDPEFQKAYRLHVLENSGTNKQQ